MVNSSKIQDNNLDKFIRRREDIKIANLEISEYYREPKGHVAKIHKIPAITKIVKRAVGKV